jgi:GNAT superfamily N-acetyltransferase
MNNAIEFYIDTECENIDDFDCGFEVFNAYLKHKFLDDRAAIHYVKDAENDDLISYFSLLASCIFLNDYVDSNVIPAIEVKMFAIDKKYRKLDLSSKLLEAVYKIARQYSLKYVGAKALILYSVPAEKVVQMYENNGFTKMPKNFLMYKSNFNDGCIPMYKFIE